MRSMATKPKKPSSPAQTKRGRAFNLYLHDADRQLIRTLAAHISANGHRVSDSQVVKAALRIAQPDKALLKAFQDVVALDGRARREE